MLRSKRDVQKIRRPCVPLTVWGLGTSTSSLRDVFKLFLLQNLFRYWKLKKLSENWWRTGPVRNVILFSFSWEIIRSLNELFFSGNNNFWFNDYSFNKIVEIKSNLIFFLPHEHKSESQTWILHGEIERANLSYYRFTKGASACS